MDFTEEFKIAVGELELSPDEFWRLTYSEFSEMVDGYRRRRTNHMNDMLYHAWHTEAFARQKKLPELKSIIRESHEVTPREQSTDEMMAMCKILNAAFGGTEIEV